VKGLLRRFCPCLRARSVLDVTPEFLDGRGIRALILDLDNTLVPWREGTPPPEVRAWARALASRGVRACIVSNTHRGERLRQVAGALGMFWVPSGMKPRRSGFRRALAAMGAAPEETAVIGDQLLTDVWGGNRLGLLTICVERLAPIEFWGTRVIHRSIERALWSGFRRWGLRVEPLEDGRGGK